MWLCRDCQGKNGKFFNAIQTACFQQSSCTAKTGRPSPARFVFLDRTVRGHSVRRQHAAEVHRLSVMPQPLQGIELPGLFREHMDADAAIVQQHPGAVPVAFPAERILSGLLLQRLFHRAAQRVDLRIGRTGGDDKVIRQSGQVRDLDGRDLLSLLLVQRLWRKDC